MTIKVTMMMMMKRGRKMKMLRVDEMRRKIMKP